MRTYTAESDEQAMDSQLIWDPVDGVENNPKVKKKKVKSRGGIPPELLATV